MNYENDWTNVESLTRLLTAVQYKDGWEFEVYGPLLRVTMPIIDSVTGNSSELCHQIPVPQWPVWTVEACERWLLERIFDIERHEACEFFVVNGRAPFFPDHAHPYVVARSAVPVPVGRKAKSRRDVTYERQMRVAPMPGFVRMR